MLSKLFLKILLISSLVLINFSCNENHPPVIEEFICDSDSVKMGESVFFEIIITDADNDPTKCFWFFNNKRIPEFDLKTKVNWTSPRTVGPVSIKVEADDGTNETTYTKTITVY